MDSETMVHWIVAEDSSSGATIAQKRNLTKQGELFVGNPKRGKGTKSHLDLAINHPSVGELMWRPIPNVSR